ncbi:queuosine precursor transporter [Corynebacterium sp. ES2775-CONJ]|uniref:queuosine precursor transporter n=1 Tax=Corynebacterium sp. ES2775-CONJ TaxID=2974029 RepID=UPI002169F790|nr:queuosine precursor transporter [Corynebacterium sp. ES2775-CONJ]MCS4490358.1 queuosine precursor transporter [Corynebacterium sp. ES2775-CONJ]
MSRYISTPSSAYPVLLALFVTIFIISNITSTKGVMMGPLVTDGAFFLFPAAYIIGDVLSECYGFRAARRAIWTGFAAMLLTVVSFYIAIALPAADFYVGQEAFATTLGLVPQIVVASLAGYAVGQLLNAWLLTWMKDRLGEHGLWKRLLGSTVLGEFGDTLIFCLIAAPVIGISTVGDTANYVLVGFLWKTGVEILVMPVTYRVIALVKQRELITE